MFEEEQGGGKELAMITGVEVMWMLFDVVAVLEPRTIPEPGNSAAEVAAASALRRD